MLPVEPNILLVCDPDDRDEIEAILRGGGYEHFAAGDGDDSTLADYQRLRPDVVIICATLSHGDARSLAEVIRSGQDGRAVKLILIGDDHGPVRNALDAADFAVDRFLGRPISPKALTFTVRTCLEAAQQSRSLSITMERPKPTENLVRKMESAMNAAIDDFVRSAMNSLPEVSAVAEVPEVLQRTEPATGADPEVAGEARARTRDPETETDIELPEPSRVRPATAHDIELPEPRGPRTRDPETDIELPAPARPPSTARGKGRRRLSSTIVATPPPPGLAQVLDQPVPEATPEPDDGDRDSVPAWREPTVVLPEDSAAAPPPPERPNSSSYARELRRKMSAMAERLFPGQKANASVDIGLAHQHAAEIDLSSFGMESAAGAADPGLDPLPPTVEYDGEDDDQTPEDVPGLDGDGDDAKPSDADAPEEATTHPAGRAEPPPPAVADSPSQPPVTPVTPAPADAGARLGEIPSWPAADPGPRTVVDHGTEGRDTDSRGAVRRGVADAGILIERMYRTRFTGRVVFRLGEAEKNILFDRGRPVFAGSRLERDRMGELLFREGKITKEQYDRVREIVDQTGRRMGEVLIEKGWLKRRELLPVVRRHIEDIVYSLFAWDSGEYRIEEGDFAASERIRISRHPAAMILEGVRRKFGGEILRALIGSPDSIIEIIEDRKLKSVVSVADLSPAERKVIASFDGERSIADVHKNSSIELIEVYQLAYGLIVWGAAQALRRGDDGQSLGAEPALFGETDLAIDRQRVLAKYSLVTEADYFSLLGVRRDATSFEIKRAYEAARRDYASDGFPADIRSELGAKIAEINEVLEEAYRILHNDALRSSYLANLRD